MTSRDTVVRKSGQLPPIPPVSVADAFSQNSQYQNLYATYQDALAGLDLNDEQVRAALQEQIAAIAKTRKQGLQAQVGTALDRGILGSSDDLLARAGVRADAAQQIASTYNQTNAALSSNDLQRLTAIRNLNAGTVDIQGQALQSQYQSILGALIAGGMWNVPALPGLAQSPAFQQGVIPKSAAQQTRYA